jgi:hypothetical protein
MRAYLAPNPNLKPLPRWRSRNITIFSEFRKHPRRYRPGRPSSVVFRRASREEFEEQQSPKIARTDRLKNFAFSPKRSD